MPPKKKDKIKKHNFKDKLILNQWLISLFGIDPLHDHIVNGKKMRPFHKLADMIIGSKIEGLDKDNLHYFYKNLFDMFGASSTTTITKEQLLNYEENIVSHTQKINEKRDRPITWKYYQWLNLLFVEIYLDLYFHDRQKLLKGLNEYILRYNAHYPEYADISPYTDDDLNKICFQNATGSGKTLLMHINFFQFKHYAKVSGNTRDISRSILITPNERLSKQHIDEFSISGISASIFVEKEKTGPLAFANSNLGIIDVIEITKLADTDGPNTIAARSLGDNNLLFVDEGHRGMSGKEEGAWFKRRADLCARGFTFEYSATFQQAVAASKSDEFENSYTKNVIFDYSYRWFYEDGFGKDYQILNLPKSFKEVQNTYFIACLLKFYQQLRVFEEKRSEFAPFNIEKPLWVFVGSTVTKAKGGVKDDEIVATDVALIIQFISDFLSDHKTAKSEIKKILTGKGQDTGLLDADGNDIFHGSFSFLNKKISSGESMDAIYKDIMARIFNNQSGGRLNLCRVKGDSGEVALKIGDGEELFGLINVGDAAGLCNHCEEVCKNINVTESEFNQSMFNSIKDSNSPVNLLIGSKKFIEGWDCWRVSTMGLMHVGKSEGSQIIQLFGRGVRLKGYNWSLKRSGYTNIVNKPNDINELELLNVFGIEADFMEKFRDYLKDEGLPGNEKRQTFSVPLNITYDIDKKLKMLKPRIKKSDGKEYDFKKDGPIPNFGEVPAYLVHNKIESDWYPRIQTIKSINKNAVGLKDEATLKSEVLEWLDYDELYFELEHYKRERSWHNFNISKNNIKGLLSNSSWYKLLLPRFRLELNHFNDINLIQQVSLELLKRYCDKYYNYCKREFIEPRLELRELGINDEILPDEKEYQFVIDNCESALINNIQEMIKEVPNTKDKLIQCTDLFGINFSKHLYQPLFHMRRGGKIAIMPISLNESEYQFIADLKDWCDKNEKNIKKNKLELFLLRNISRKGVGFFEAGNFYPDFILWILYGDKQYISFIDPHGLRHEGPASEKINLHLHIKEIEKRLNDPNAILNSFILSWTKHPELNWGMTKDEYEKRHVLFMNDNKDEYIDKIFNLLGFKI